MKRIMFLLALLGWYLSAQQNVKVTYIAKQASVEEIVRTIAAQAGFTYNLQKSLDRADPLCRHTLRDVSIEAVPFETAMRQTLEPVGLQYEIADNSIVLFRGPNAVLSAAPEGPVPATVAGKRISYSVEKKSVQYVVIDLAARVGLGYNWEKSFTQTDPICRKFLFNVWIANETFQDAMDEILGPVGLRYQVEAGRVVLYRR